jgi:integrase
VVRETQLVFLSTWWSETAIRRTWAAACKKAGVTGVSLCEGTKHSISTRLKALGVDDRFLAQLMDDRDMRSVEEKYAKLDRHAIRAGLDRLHSKKDPDE